VKHLLQAGDAADLRAVDVIHDGAEGARVLRRLIGATESSHAENVIQESHVSS